MFAHNRALVSVTGCSIVVAGVLLAGCQSPLDRPRQGHAAVPQHPQLRADGEIAYRPPEERQRGEGAPGAALEIGEDAELADYLAYAAANSPALRAAFYRWRAAVERVPQVTSLPDPMVGYGYFLEEFTARRPMEQHVFELSQTFPWFGKLELRGDAAALAAEEAAHEYESVRLGLFLDVRRAYYELYQLGREIEITRENLELLQQFEEIARAQFRVGAATHADVVLAQVELGRVEDRLRQLEQLRDPALARFNAALGRQPMRAARGDAAVVWPTMIVEERLGTDVGEMGRVLARANPRLRGFEAEIERERTEMEVARRDSYPDVTLGTMFALRGDNPAMVSAMINVPIWRERYRAGVREARARRVAAAYLREDAGVQLEADLHEAVYAHDDADRRVSLYRQTLLPKARESLQASLAGYQAGTTTFLALLDAERTLLEFELALSRAVTDRAIALARLDALVGEPVARAAAENLEVEIEENEQIEQLESPEEES